MGRKLGQNSKQISCRSKISSYGSKTFQELIWQGTPSKKPYSAGMSKIQKLHEKYFFCAAAETTFFCKNCFRSPKNHETVSDL